MAEAVLFGLPQMSRHCQKQTLYDSTHYEAWFFLPDRNLKD